MSAALSFNGRELRRSSSAVLTIGCLVILVCASVDTVEKLMSVAQRLGMTDSGKYVFISIHIHSDMQDDFSWQLNNVTELEREEYLRSYASLKIVTLRRPPQFLYRRFEEDVKRLAQEKFNYTKLTGKPYRVTKFTSAFYDGILLYAIALNETVALGFSPRNGVEVTKRMWNRSFTGIGGKVTISKDGDRFSDYSVLDLNPDTGSFDEVAYYAGSQDKLYVVGKWHWVAGEPPPDEPICGFDNSKCPSKELAPWALVLIVISVLSVIFGVISFFVFRHYKLEAELRTMSWRIFWDELSGQKKHSKCRKRADSRAFHWLHEQKRSMSNDDNYENSFTSLADSLCSVDEESFGKPKNTFTKVANYRGQIVAVKMLNIQRSRIELSRDLLLELKKMKDLSHEHVTRFVGACIDAPHYCVVTEYCQKGSLQDILENSGIKLDKMMRYSLMHDIIKIFTSGMTIVEDFNN